MVVFSALPEVGWVSAKNVNKLIKSGKVSLVIPSTIRMSKLEVPTLYPCPLFLAVPDAGRLGEREDQVGGRPQRAAPDPEEEQAAGQDRVPLPRGARQHRLHDQGM